MHFKNISLITANYVFFLLRAEARSYSNVALQAGRHSAQHNLQG